MDFIWYIYDDNFRKWCKKYELNARWYFNEKVGFMLVDSPYNVWRHLNADTLEYDLSNSQYMKIWSTFRKKSRRQ